jgi:hypothetical protein
VKPPDRVNDGMQRLALLAALCTAFAGACSERVGPEVQATPSFTVDWIFPNYGALAGGTQVMVHGDWATVDSVRVGPARLRQTSDWAQGWTSGVTPPGSARGTADVTVFSGDGFGICRGCFTYHSAETLPRYSVTFLGVGLDSSLAWDMNDSGTVVGWAWKAGVEHGWMWPSVGTATDLDTLWPRGINNSGTIVGNLSLSRPALWENGAVHLLGGLGVLPSGLAYAATDINDRRQVAVGEFQAPFQSLAAYPAFLWQADSLIPLVYDASPGRMNNRGEVAATTGGTYSSGAVLSAGAPPRWVGAGGRYSSADVINDAGVVGGWGEYIMGSNWTGGYMSGVGPLPFIPVAINDSTQAVGEGAIWQGRDSATAELSSLVTDSTWHISRAVAINDRGQIAAYGVNIVTGQQGAVRLDPIAHASGSSAKRLR